jgi:membrane-bound lytic murein transglycosylase A
MMAGGRRLVHRTGQSAAAGLMLLLGVTAVAQSAEGDKPSAEAKREAVRKVRLPNTQLVPTDWANVDGWTADDQLAAFNTFMASCKAILAGSREQDSRPMYKALRNVCERADTAKPKDAAEARKFFEDNFRPVRISSVGETEGFITGYYEPVVEGSREPTAEYVHPLYRKPANLLPGGRMLAAVAAGKKHKGKGRRKARSTVPFFDRTSIENGAIKGRNLEICYLKDPVDAFFVEIQGSARVKLADGGTLRLNYAAQNGHKYFAVGKVLVDRNVFTREEMTMQRIRQWMTEHPDEGRELRRMNKSVVFFRETSLTQDEEPAGAEGVSLTPERSIAVDRRLHVYGTPFFISANLPLDNEQTLTPFRRLMIAQDTGGAIVGPARADIYFGSGPRPEEIAGRLKHWGQFVMLFPKELDPAAVRHHVPLPPPRPAIEMLIASGKPDQPGTAHAAEPPVNAPAAGSQKALARPVKTAAKPPAAHTHPVHHRTAKTLKASAAPTGLAALLSVLRGDKSKVATKKPAAPKATARKAKFKPKS